MGSNPIRSTEPQGKDMQGTNEIRFNESTMQTAVEHYLNTVMLNSLVKVVVTKVEQTTESYNVLFKILFEPAVQEEPNAS